MFQASSYISRRKALTQLMREMGGRGLVVIMGNELSPNSYPSNSYYFRQDSSFRYLFGLERAGVVATIDLDDERSILWGDDNTLDDIIWSGIQPTIADLGAECGVDSSRTLLQLKAYIEEAQRLERTIHILPPYRGETKISLARLLSTTIDGIERFHSYELIVAMAELRECKSEEEIAEIERGYEISYQMHTEAMRLCRPGVIEREIGGRLEGIARAMGAGVSFTPIATQHGETLHNISREGVLRSGRIMLCDAGGETLEGYASDHTRSYPIDGRFTDIQRDIYNIVLSAHDAVAAMAAPNLPYQMLQECCYRTLANGLLAIGAIRGEVSLDQILESGAMRMLMPHGVGHSMGLDVHDCEAYGERSFDLRRYSSDISAITTAICRSQWRLRPGTVLTDEPGLYFIPALIEKQRAEGRYNDIFNWAFINQHLDFGGIRIEDDLVITDNGAKMIGSDRTQCIPITVNEIEQFMNSHR